MITYYQGRSGKHSRSQSLSVDPSEARAVAEMALGGSHLSVSTRTLTSRSAANSPAISRARHTEVAKRRSGESQDTDGGLSESESEDISDVTDFSDTDEDLDGDNDDFKPSTPTGSTPMRVSSGLNPPAAAAGGASPFSKGHRRNQSVDHTALKKAQEVAPAHVGGSVDELKTRTDKRDSKDHKSSAKEEKKAAKEGKAAAKLEAREAKEQVIPFIPPCGLHTLPLRINLNFMSSYRNASRRGCRRRPPSS